MPIRHEYTIPKPEGEVRVCRRCGRRDSPVFTGEYDVHKKPIFDHQVTIDLAWIERAYITPAEKSAGFSFVRIADRNAKMREMCRGCLDLTEEEQKVWRDFKLQREKDQQIDVDDPYYSQLCSE
jgi:hypothetical protein